jgi:hypothetical protein
MKLVQTYRERPENRFKVQTELNERWVNLTVSSSSADEFTKSRSKLRKSVVGGWSVLTSVRRGSTVNHLELSRLKTRPILTRTSVYTAYGSRSMPCKPRSTRQPESETPSTRRRVYTDSLPSPRTMRSCPLPSLRSSSRRSQYGRGAAGRPHEVGCAARVEHGARPGRERGCAFSPCVTLWCLRVIRMLVAMSALGYFGPGSGRRCVGGGGT